jgi:hypothetical protein
MRIRSKRFTPVLVLVASLLLPLVAPAQNPSAQTGEWSALGTLATGSKLAVKLKSGKSFEGKLSSVTDAALSLSVKSKPVELKREDVLSVYQIRGHSATKATLIGAGVGAGAGAVVGLAGSGGDDSFNKLDKAVTAGLTVLGAGAGALTGYLIGRRGGKRVLIYQASRP